MQNIILAESAHKPREQVLASVGQDTWFAQGWLVGRRGSEEAEVDALDIDEIGEIEEVEDVDELDDDDLEDLDDDDDEEEELDVV